MPDKPAMPLASRERPVADARELDVAKAIQQIETHLAANPEDGRGHEVVAPVYMRMGRYADAVRAFSVALRVLGPNAGRHTNLGEALVYQANGIVTAEARAAFEAAAGLDPKLVKVRFFLALAAQQDGDKAKAVMLLSALRDDLVDGDLKDEIGKQLAELGAMPEGGAAVAALPPPEQQQAIRSMVEGLAQRLATSGGTAEEWARLIRALIVLNERERAQAILTEARQKFAADPEALKRIDEAGRAP
jgi:cytochrome c-type biogenesis protein CcmH